jgi:phosphate-selective porin
LFIALTTNAQENSTAATQPKSEVESLRKKLEEQETQINQLKQTMQRQSELIERQQRLLESLEKRIEPASTATATPTGTETSASTAQSKPAEEKPPAKTAPTTNGVEAGYGKIKFNGLLQGWFSTGNGGFSDTFRLRRAELKFSGQITPKAKWTVMIDPAKALSLNNTYTTINGTRVVADTSVNQASRILQDAFITLDYIKKIHIDVGQFKVPLSLEGLQSSATLETVERAMFASDRARGGTFGDIRDLGVMIRGGFNKHVDYQLGFFNGSGENQNDVDRNDQKAVIGRFVVRPSFVRGLQIGASGAWGNGQRADRPRRDRLGAELLFTRDRFTFKSEVMGGTDANLHRLGYYTHFGYRIKPKLEAIFRFDSWDPDRRLETNASNVTERDYITGFNYFITENKVKLQFNYLRKTFANGIVPSRNLVLVNLQTSW